MNSLNGTRALLIDSTVARVALAWVHQRPGVTSTIIGARRIGQLEDNLKSLEVTLTAAEVAKLDAATAPPAIFPQRMEGYFPAIHNGGTWVNGVQQPPTPFGVQAGDRPY